MRHPIVVKLTLLVVALLLGLRAVSARMGVLAIIEMAGLALVVEVLYLVQLGSINSATKLGLRPSLRFLGDIYAVGFGFWLTLGVTLALLGVAVYGWLHRRRAAA